MFKNTAGLAFYKVCKKKMQSITIVGSNSELFLLLQNYKMMSRHFVGRNKELSAWNLDSLIKGQYFYTKKEDLGK